VMDRAAAMSSMVLVVRTDGDAKAILPALRAALHNLDPTVPLADARTMSEVISEQLAFERMEGWLFGTFASLALVLALVGLYGLVAHEVEQSTRDIGVRMALGATKGSRGDRACRVGAYRGGTGGCADSGSARGKHRTDASAEKRVIEMMEFPQGGVAG